MEFSDLSNTLDRDKDLFNLLAFDYEESPAFQTFFSDDLPDDKKSVGARLALRKGYLTKYASILKFKKLNIEEDLKLKFDTERLTNNLTKFYRKMGSTKIAFYECLDDGESESSCLHGYVEIVEAFSAFNKRMFEERFFY